MQSARYFAELWVTVIMVTFIAGLIPVSLVIEDTDIAFFSGKMSTLCVSIYLVKRDDKINYRKIKNAKDRGL